ncbi:MAG TPA: hypothetical protein VF549_10890 [Solirubrobacteraceae bacterium]
MTTRSRTSAAALALVSAAFAAAAPAAHAADRSVLVGTEHVALAGDDVIAASAARDQGVVVSRIGPRGRSARLARFAPPEPRDGVHAVIAVAASATTWAVGLKWVRIESGENGGTIDLAERVAEGAVTGGAPRILAGCRSPRELDDPLVVAVAGDDVAWSDAACDGAEGVWLAPAGGAAPRLVSNGHGVALTDRLIARYEGSPPSIIVSDRAGDAVQRVDASDVSGFALADDGVAAVIATDRPGCPTSCTMSVMRLAGADPVRPGLVHTPTTVPVGGSDTLVAGAGRVLAQRARGNGLVAVDPGSGATSYAGLLGLDFDATLPVAVDATQAIYTAPRCDGRIELRFETTSPEGPARIGAVPCPVRVASRIALLSRHRRRATFRVRCPAGCSTGLDAAVRGRYVGTASFTVRAGETKTVRMRLESVAPLRGLTRTTLVLTEDEPRPRAPRPAPLRVAARVVG